jgi:O-antigen ligase
LSCAWTNSLFAHLSAAGLSTVGLSWDLRAHAHEVADMSGYALDRPSAGRRRTALLVVVALGPMLAAGLAFALAAYPPTLGLAVAAGVSLVAVLLLALVSQEAAALLGFGLLGIVLFEPAPADLVFFVVIAVALVTGRFRLRGVPPVVIGIIGVFLALNLLSAVEVVDVARALTFFSTTVYMAVLGLWITGWVTTRPHAKLAAGGYLFAAVAGCALGLVALFVAVPGQELIVGEGRIVALFKDPNVFGAFVVPVVLILLEEILTPRLFRMRLALKGLLLLVLALGVLFSYSRGAWANLAVGVGVLLTVLALRRGGGRKVLPALSLVLVAALLVAGAVAVTGSADFLAERAQLQSYDSDRFGAWVAGLEPAQRYPFGVGPGQFEQIASISAHSTYVRTIAEQGLPGFICIAALMTFTLVAAVGNAAAGRDTFGIGSAALLGAWCGLLVNSFVIDTLHWRHLWIVAALIWAGWARRRAGERALEREIGFEGSRPGYLMRGR